MAFLMRLRNEAEVWLVLPCFNEAERLPTEAIEQAVLARPWLNLVFVDDGSTDRTRATLQALADRLPAGRARLLPLSQNLGKAEAVRAGLIEALTFGRAELVGYWDADLSAPLDELEGMCAAMVEGVDLVLGSRVMVLGSQIERRLVRHLGGRGVATLISVLLGLPVYDSQCGAKLLRVEPALAELLARPFCSRWLFDVELLARWMRLHPGQEHRLREQPLSRWSHAAGSKLRASEALAAPAELLRIARAEGLLLRDARGRSRLKRG